MIHLHATLLVVLDPVVVHGEEGHVDNDAEGDEDLCERVKDEESQELADLDPHATAVPDAEDVDDVFEVLEANHLAIRSLVVVVVVVIVIPAVTCVIAETERVVGDTFKVTPIGDLG